jgi:hypothetical protein
MICVPPGHVAPIGSHAPSAQFTLFALTVVVGQGLTAIPSAGAAALKAPHSNALRVGINI